MDCSDIDPDTALRAIKKTRNTGNEHAFAVCSDGTTSEIVEGTERQVNIDVDCESGQAGIFHVHPNDVMHLSDQDMSVLEHDEIDMVCVGDTQGNMKCELDGEEYACVSDLKEKGGANLESAPHALYDDDGTEYELALLPKGSRCVDYKSVPSRSDYHDTDTVDRCARFSDSGRTEPYEVTFASRQSANLARDFAEEHTHSRDDRRSKTVVLQPDAPEDVVNHVVGMAADSREYETEQYGQVSLTDSEKDRIDFSETSVPHARSAKAIAVGKGVDDWLAYYDPSLTVDEHRDVYEAAKQDEQGMRTDPDQTQEAIKHAAKGHRRQQTEQCPHAEKHCTEHCDEDACEFIKERCGYTDDDISSHCETLAQHQPLESELDLESSGDVILWFHPKAEGCRCSSQAVQMDELAQNHSAQVVGVNTESEAHNERFADAYDLSFPIVSDTEHDLIERFDVPLNDDGRPERTTVFVRDGEEIDRVHGLFSAEDAGKRLESAECGCGHEVSEPPEILEKVEHPSVVTITGKRRSGKSSLAYHIGEELYQHDGVPPVTVNVPEATAEKLPDHWTHVSSIRNAPNNSVIVYDEAYRSIHSRTPHSDENLDLTEVVELSAQRGQTLLFVTQNSAILDKVAVGESDVMMIKKPGKLSMKFERTGVRDLSQEARERFDMLPDDADHREYVYVYGEDGETFMQNGEAPFYDDDISRSFACPFEPDEKRVNVE